MGLVHSPKIVTDGLVLALDAGNVKSYPGSGTTWYDKSGNGNNGTLTNGPTFSDGSIVFDGVDDYAEITQRNTDLEFQPTQPYTCLVVFKSPSTPPPNSSLFSNMESSSPYQGWDLWFNNVSVSNTISMHLISSWHTNAIKIAVTYDYTSYANQWVYFGYTYDGSSPTTLQGSLDSVNFYLNGILYTLGKQLGSPGGGEGFNTSSETISYNTSQRFRVGSRWLSSGFSAGANITIATLQIYNRALSSQEILQNYNATKSRFGL